MTDRATVLMDMWRQRLQWQVWVRIAMVGMGALSPLYADPPPIVAWGMVGYLVPSLAMIPVARNPKVGYAAPVVAVAMLADVLCMLLATYALGAEGSPVLGLLPVIVIGWAVCHSVRIGALTAALSVLGYGVILAAEHVGLVPHAPAVIPGQPTGIDGPLTLWLLFALSVGGTFAYLALALDRLAADARRLASLEEARRSEGRERLEALGTLAGGVAHDVNNLLAGILGTAEIVKQDLAAGRARAQDLDTIIQACEAGGGVAADLLQFARQQSGVRKPLHVHAVVHTAARLLKHTLPRSVTLTHDVDPALWVQGDAAQVQSVLINLAVNASAAAGPQGSVHITARPHHATSRPLGRGPAELPPGAYVALAVEDDGPGMSPDVVARAFEPFFTTRADHGGTGLGLSLVYGIATAHGGTAEVQSAPGRGTTVTVWLPRTERPADAPAVAPAPAPVPDTPLPPAPEPELDPAPGPPGDAAPVPSPRVLWIDDEALIRRVASRLLRSMACDVEVAASGEAGLDALTRAPDGYDVVFLDMTMPGLGGPGTFLALRALRADLPVVVCSGHSPHIAEVLGHDDRVRFLAKPFDRDGLSAALTDALSGSGRAA